MGIDLAHKRCFVLDLDGTVYLGAQPIEPAVAFVRAHLQTHRFFFLTNNTSKTPDDYVARLAGLGIPTQTSQILSPHIPLLAHLEREGVDRVYPVANRRYVEFLRRERPSLAPTDDPAACQAVVLAYDTELTYDKLRTAALLLQRDDVAYIATHIDDVCPTEHGPVPDIGSFMALFERATGRRPDVVFGKPNPSMLDAVRREFPDEAIVMAGDRLYTDKLLAENAGVDFILVLSGESTRADAEACETPPGLVLPDLGHVASLI